MEHSYLKVFQKTCELTANGGARWKISKRKVSCVGNENLTGAIINWGTPRGIVCSGLSICQKWKFFPYVLPHSSMWGCSSILGTPNCD